MDGEEEEKVDGQEEGVRDAVGEKGEEEEQPPDELGGEDQRAASWRMRTKMKKRTTDPTTCLHRKGPTNTCCWARSISHTQHEAIHLPQCDGYLARSQRPKAYN